MELEEIKVRTASSATAHPSRKAYNVSVRNLCYTPDERGTLLRMLHSARAQCLSLISCIQGSRALPPSPTSLHSNQVYEMSPRQQEEEGAAPQPAVKNSKHSSSSSSSSRPRREILKNVSFDALSGEVTAIAGPSGAGKSTLLSLMAGQLHSSSCSLLVNGAPVGAAQMRRMAGYVTQDDDALFPFLTVHETLLYSARLRIPAAVPWPDKLAKVEAVMAELGLSHVAHSIIGDPTDTVSRVRQISGGERRRTSIGAHSVHDPAILFLDEPTSGLDSGAALQVVAMLQGAATAKSRTIVLSVHQPSALMIRHFSKIVLLAEGEVAYDGSLDGLAARLQAAGQSIPPEMTALECAMRSKMLVLPLVGATIVPEAIAGHEVVDSCAEYANGWLLETCILASRFYRTSFRGRSLASTVLLQALVTSLGLGLLFLHTGRRLGERGIHQRNGFLAYSLTFLLTSAATQGLPIFLQDRMILTREASRGAYRVSSYVLSTCVVFVAFLLPVAIVFAVPAYFMLGLSADSGSFIFFMLVCWVSLATANSLSSLVTALIPRYIEGYSLTQSLIGVFFLFSGYFIAKHDIPDYMVFLSYFSLFKFPLEALLINEFSALKGEDVLREAGLSGQSKWTSLVVMAGFAVAYRIFCTLILKASILYG